GVNQTLCEVRLNVWISKGRIAVKQVINNLCYHCKRYKARPFMLPEFPAHPERRDHYFYKNESNTNSKYWILLLSYLNTRAIYVEIVPDMSSVTLLQAPRRFFASIAYPRWILCDNAKSFQVIDELQNSIDKSKRMERDVIDFCTQRNIEFKLKPRFSSRQCGLYEKLIHIFQISTIGKETETIVNSRPLTYVEENDQDTPLRPIDFLSPWTTLSLPRKNEETSK
ncbi:hypothetical protein OSTOST_25655, partial [Ostertagia ostertagi]